MSTPYPKEPISPLRARMIEDMRVRSFSLATQRGYIRGVKMLATFLGRSPDTATAEEVRALAEATYGRHSRRADIAPRLRPKEPPALVATHVVLQDQRAGAPIFLRYHHAPSLSSAKETEAESVAVLMHVLGGDDTSRLYRRLVLELALAAHAATDYQSTGLDSGRLALLAVAAAPDKLGALEAALDEVISEVRAKGISEDELVRAKLALEASVDCHPATRELGRWHSKRCSSRGRVQSPATGLASIRRLATARIPRCANPSSPHCLSSFHWLSP